MKATTLTVTTAIAPIIWGTTYYVTTELLPAGRPMTASYCERFQQV